MIENRYKIGRKCKLIRKCFGHKNKMIYKRNTISTNHHLNMVLYLSKGETNYE